jgi:hypothetical protein
MNGYGSEKPRRKTLKVVLIVLVFAVALAGVGVVRGWRAFVRFGVSGDLTKYQASISASDLDPQTKRRLAGRIDLIRESARDKSIGFFRWLSYDESFKAIFADQRVTPEEALILERELSRLEREFE